MAKYYVNTSDYIFDDTSGTIVSFDELVPQFDELKTTDPKTWGKGFDTWLSDFHPELCPFEPSDSALWLNLPTLRSLYDVFTHHDLFHAQLYYFDKCIVRELYYFDGSPICDYIIDNFHVAGISADLDDNDSPVLNIEIV